MKEEVKGSLYAYKGLHIRANLGKSKDVVEEKEKYIQQSLDI